MKKILLLSAQTGHLSISQAVEEILKQAGFKVYKVDLLPSYAFSVYIPLYRYFPPLINASYKMGEKDVFQKGLHFIAVRHLEKTIKNEIKTKKPDLIISTHFFYNPAVKKILGYQKIPIPFINIISDPRPFYPLMLAPDADYNFVYDDQAANFAQKNKIPFDKIAPSGWFVRKEFYQKYDLNKIRKGLGFRKDVFTLLICGGSEGTNAILKIIPGLLTIKKPLQIIAVCGNNPQLYQALTALKQTLPRLSRVKGLKKLSQRLNLKLFKFTNQLPQLMASADLVIGKAGPNLLFETIASKKPFFALCHISHEIKNLDLIKEKNLGLVQEKPIKATKLLKKIINQPKILDQFKESINKEREYNLGAGKRLIKLVNSLLS